MQGLNDHWWRSDETFPTAPYRAGSEKADPEHGRLEVAVGVVGKARKARLVLGAILRTGMYDVLSVSRPAAHCSIAETYNATICQTGSF